MKLNRKTPFSLPLFISLILPAHSHVAFAELVGWFVAQLVTGGSGMRGPWQSDGAVV